MMQTADVRQRDDLAALGRFNFSFNRRVSIERQVRPRMMIIVEIIGKNPPQVVFFR